MPSIPQCICDVKLFTDLLVVYIPQYLRDVKLVTPLVVFCI